MFGTVLGCLLLTLEAVLVENCSIKPCLFKLQPAVVVVGSPRTSDTLFHCTMHNAHGRKVGCKSSLILELRVAQVTIT